MFYNCLMILLFSQIFHGGGTMRDELLSIDMGQLQLNTNSVRNFHAVLPCTLQSEISLLIFWKKSTQDSFIAIIIIHLDLQVHREYMYYEEITICRGWKLSIFCDRWHFRCLQWENGSKFQFVLGGKKNFADPPVYSNPPAY